MKLLDQYISQIGKQPSDWTSDDVQKYLDYVKAHVTEVIVSKSYDTFAP